MPNPRSLEKASGGGGWIGLGKLEKKPIHEKAAHFLVSLSIFKKKTKKPIFVVGLKTVRRKNLMI